MLAFTTIATFLAVAYSASAHPRSLVSRGGAGGGSCSTGPAVACCDSVLPVSSLQGLLGGDKSLLSGTADLFTVLGTKLDVGTVVSKGGLLGLGCTAANTCTTQTACCSGINTSGTAPVGLYCDPININA